MNDTSMKLQVRINIAWIDTSLDSRAIVMEIIIYRYSENNGLLNLPWNSL